MMRILIFSVLMIFLSTIPVLGKLSKKELISVLTKYNEAVNIGDSYAIGKAIKKLGEDDSSRVVKVILKTALKFEDKEIYQACVVALRKIQSPKALKTLFSQLKSSSIPVQLILLEVIKNRKEKKITKLIAQKLKSSYPAIILTAIRILIQRQDKTSILPLINLLKKRDKRKLGGLTSFEARVALHKLTGQDYPTGKEWEKFWTVSKNNSVGSHGRTVIRKMKRTGPRLFSETVVSDRVLFILDISASMDEKDPLSPEEEKEGRKTVQRKKPKKVIPVAQLPANRRRIERAKKQLIQVIRHLPRGAKFNIITFHSKVRAWSSKMRSATSGSKNSAIRFVASLTSSGKTATHSALVEAFKNKKADTIYLLSDGEPTVGPSTAAILDFVYKANRFRKIRINTLGFPGVNKDFMMRLSQNHQGHYADIR